MHRRQQGELRIPLYCARPPKVNRRKKTLYGLLAVSRLVVSERIMTSALRPLPFTRRYTRPVQYPPHSHTIRRRFRRKTRTEIDRPIQVSLLRQLVFGLTAAKFVLAVSSGNPIAEELLQR